MRLALIADVYPPLRSSGAVQLRDLSMEFSRQGHQVTILVATPDLTVPWTLEMWNGVQVLRLKTPRTKDMGYARRTVAEFLMPYFMLHQLHKTPIRENKWDGVIWYSPTIFLGPIARALKSHSGCKSYLIIRDIFPEWAVDMGLMGRGLPYLFFKAVANYQYAVADIIGIQTSGNRKYFTDWQSKAKGKLEVLQNWLSDAPDRGCVISVSRTKLSGRKIFVYAGNMGIAQGMGVLLNLADQFSGRSDVGFIFVGRGSESNKLRIDAENRGLDNVLFFDEIDPDEIPGLYAQCNVGLIALDPRHKTHNIPGKFLSYMQAGLPVLATVNAGNDIVDLIESEGVGQVCTDNSVATLKVKADHLLMNFERGLDYAVNCKALSSRRFSPEVAVKQIVSALQE